MIATKNNSIQVESNVQGEKIAMGIDPAAMAHIMSILTDLYSDPEYAVIREYSTNAFDSHVEAGQTRPIEVTLPTDLAPFLTIRDFGIGLDAEGIESIYSLYGASTKRNTNDQVGMLGLGCKSALTYTSQFTLVGIKDGVRTVVSISRDDDGTGAMTIIDSGPTDEGNGVEVKIPVKRFNNIEKKARNFFRFWTPGTVLVNGVAPDPVDGLYVTDNILLANNMSNQDYVVMGNVPYPVDLSVYFQDGDTGIVAFVDIGTVEFTPSREALYYGNTTNATIEAIKEDYKANVEGAVERTIAEADTFQEAFRRAHFWRTLLGRRIKPSYKGIEIPDQLVADDGNQFVLTSANSNKLSSHNRVKAVNANALIHGIIIHGYDLTNFTATHKKKIAKYCHDNGIAADHYILIDPKPNMQWIEPEKLHNWEDIKAIKLEINRVYAATNRPKGSYDVYVDGEHEEGTPADEIDTSKPICYINTTDDGKDMFYHIGGNVLKRLEWKGTVVALASNRVDKFLRDFPKAKPAQKVVARLYKLHSKKVTERDYLIAEVKRQGSLFKRACEYFDPNKVNDPEVKDAIALHDADTSEAYKTLYNTFSNEIVRWCGAERKMAAAVSFSNPFDKYDLLRLSYAKPSSTEMKHIYTYMNAIYAQSLIDQMKKA